MSTCNVSTICADVAGLVVLVVSHFNWLPAATTAFGAAMAGTWYGIQIWESPYGKRWRERWRRVLRL